ncbi:MAG: hypothetical protein K5945_09475 [Bacteroidaceae bacterium]|nr:hypothetical protein [Bacteroidaceae bacterium]
MKKVVFFALLALACALVYITAQRDSGRSFASLQEEFACPSKEFRTAPLWVWNTDVTEEDIDRMLCELKEQGFGGAFIHPRPGLETEYLSDEWFRLWEYALDKGKELGLDIWIYDENSYPSGFAGGHVPNEMPESYNQGQVLLGRRSNEVPDSCFLCLLKEGDQFTDITERLAEYKGIEGEYYIYRIGYNQPSTWTGGFPYVDLMVKGVTEKFIDVTMTQGYEKHLGKRLGTEVKGTFTDEPQIAPPVSGHCRWTPDLFSTFQELWGYDLRVHWPQLGEQTGDWKKVRHDYNATLLHLFIERWSKPWHDYCERKHIKWTGHYWEHGWPDLAHGPDNMAMYAWHQMPAIDMLFNQYNDDDNCQAQFGNVRSVKELRSVANQMGCKRTLSETYGGGGWDERLVDFKRLGDWEFALGVNFMNQHLSHMTITGTRKYDYPPVFTSLSPWWSDYGQLNTYFARLSSVLSQGEQLNDWLILEPTTSLWLHYTRVAGGEPLWQIARAFQSLITRLEKSQMEYDLGSEDIIRRWGKVSRQGFTIGQRTYRRVLLPRYMENLESSTFKLLKQYAEKGGLIIAMSVPTRLDGAESEEVKAFFESDKVLHLDSASDVLDYYNAECPLQICFDGSDHLYHYHNTYKDGELLFFANSSMDEEAHIDFSLPGKYLYQLDAMTGNISFAEEAEKVPGRVTSFLTLPPAGSALYFASDKQVLEVTSPPSLSRSERKALVAKSDLHINPVRPNALNLDFCNLTVDGAQWDNIFHKVANDRLWQAFGMRDPWEHAIQFRHDILDRDTFTHGDIKVEYPFHISETFDWTDMTLTVERPDLWQVAVNGTALSSYAADSLLDHRCGVFAIGRALRLGDNTVTLSMPRMNIRAEIGPAILMGRFSLANAPRGFVLTAAPDTLRLGDYTLQGYPEYPWPMAYAKQYIVDSTSVRHFVRLGRWQGTAAQVWVNGSKAGTIFCPPYTLDVTPLLLSGTNEVEVRVIGSLANLYGPHYSAPNGLMGPHNWNGVQEQLPGASYHVFPYGLEDDFELLAEE